MSSRLGCSGYQILIIYWYAFSFAVFVNDAECAFILCCTDFRYVVSRGLEDEVGLLGLFVTELVGLVHESRAKKAAEASDNEEEDSGGALLLLPGYQVQQTLSIMFQSEDLEILSI